MKFKLYTKFLTVLLAAIVLCAVPSLAMAAGVGSTFTSGDLTYKVLTSTTVQVGNGGTAAWVGLGSAATIPSKVGSDGTTYTVTSVGDDAFLDCTGVKSITIPSSVTSIGNHAFDSCTSLASITIPSSVTSIGTHAFYSCTYLTSVTIPAAVKSIGESAFYLCTALKSVTLPNSVTSIGVQVFYQCTALTSITIPSSVTSIGPGAFEYSGLTSITIPKSVNSIGYNALAYCARLTSVTFSSATTVIYDGVDTIPAGAKIIGCVPSTAKNYATKYGRAFSVVQTVLSTTTKLSGHSSVKAKHSYTLSGTVSRSVTGKVTITITRKSGGKWKSVSKPTVSVKSGKFHYTLKPKYKGSWHFVAKFAGSKVGNTTYTSSHSATKSVKVK